MIKTRPARMTAVSISLLMILAHRTPGASIAVNFASLPNGAALDLLPTEVTGVISQGNWNNAHSSNPSTPNLLNQQGVPTTASLFANQVAGTPESNPLLTPLDKLLRTEILMGGPGNTKFGPTVSGVPYLTYDVYLYFVNAVEAFPGSGFYTVNGTTTPHIANYMPPTSTFVDAGVNHEGTPPFVHYLGNYVRFQGVHGSTLSIGGISEPGGYLGLAGFQVVEVPEPASATLLACAGFALVVLCRRRTRA
jgi:hypothetical protein